MNNTLNNSNDDTYKKIPGYSLYTINQSGSILLNGKTRPSKDNTYVSLGEYSYKTDTIGRHKYGYAQIVSDHGFEDTRLISRLLIAAHFSNPLEDPVYGYRYTHVVEIEPGRYIRQYFINYTEHEINGKTYQSIPGFSYYACDDTDVISVVQRTVVKPELSTKQAWVRLLSDDGEWLYMNLLTVKCMAHVVPDPTIQMSKHVFREEDGGFKWISYNDL